MCIALPTYNVFIQHYYRFLDWIVFTQEESRRGRIYVNRASDSTISHLLLDIDHLQTEEHEFNVSKES